MRDWLDKTVSSHLERVALLFFSPATEIKNPTKQTNMRRYLTVLLVSKIKLPSLVETFYYIYILSDFRPLRDLVLAHVKKYDNFHTCRLSPFHTMAYFKKQFMKAVLFLYNKQNNTKGLGDMEFIFSCSNRHLTRSLRSLVPYRF